ncbi:putative Fe-S protein YdhL (DUF1289 family) [Neisseria sp. HSC-16F19]|nr:DUF1289 domain-containing protein [Neisseria sp. HSC-16F19]MCP2039520.1 putative Fe-S protein YdhL (DUF1289 family) [Neisseria sp. HSC-16F19]
MEQLEFFALPNPCVGVCEANSKGYCKGCLRSREERQFWLKMSEAQKRQVLRLCQIRRRKLQQAAERGQDEEMPQAGQMGLDF